jgi:hypothetical protein
LRCLPQAVPDYLWAVSPSPFGPFAHGFGLFPAAPSGGGGARPAPPPPPLSLPFAIQDAAARHEVLAQLVRSLAALRRSIRRFVRHSVEPARVLPAATHRALVRRWNLHREKLRRVSWAGVCAGRTG